MKRYNILLLSLYAVVIAVIFVTTHYYNNQVQEIKKNFKQVVNNQKIKRIVIENTESKLDIYYTNEGDKFNWKLRGRVDQNDLDKIYIKDSVLHIENIDKWKLSVMKINRNIPIEIVNSPRVKILPNKEDKESLDNKKIKLNYEL